MRKKSEKEGGRDAAARARPESACDVCGGPTYEVRCKVVCPRCGYTRDCSDP